MSAEAVRLWVELLDRFDADLACVEHGSGGVPCAWQPPIDFPPLPVELADRAGETARRQQAAIAALSASLRDLRAQVASWPRAKQKRPSSVPVYLDLLG
ncbi:MAG: hypothetical protein EPN48_10170 [Microbacteriaceae bacterium]|nr:MAG: hypothetical protein EPN48_10170 [Microbacteriaceae bacterium]